MNHLNKLLKYLLWYDLVLSPIQNVVKYKYYSVLKVVLTVQLAEEADACNIVLEPVIDINQLKPLVFPMSPVALSILIIEPKSKCCQ